MRADQRWRRSARVSAAAAVVGAVIAMIGTAIAPQAVAAGYLAAYAATAAVAVGTLLLIMIARVTGATWFVVFRRQAEAIVGALPVFAVLALPLVVAPQVFWPWAAPLESLPTALQEAIRPKRTYLAPWFFALRTMAYWAVWLCAAEMLRRISHQQDSGDARADSRLGILSIAGLIVGGPILTLAAVDWLMSITPGWTSSVFGVYYFSGGMAGALALLGLVAFVGRRDSAVTVEHLHALGKLMLGFVLFRGYIWYSQFFIIWIGGIPGETEWYAVRFQNGWDAVVGCVLVAGFALPVLLLLFRFVKRTFHAMAFVGACVLTAQWLDVYWQVAPGVLFEWIWLDAIWALATLAIVVGSAVAVALWRDSGTQPLRVGDPLLMESLRYEAR